MCYKPDEMVVIMSVKERDEWLKKGRRLLNDLNDVQDSLADMKSFERTKELLEADKEDRCIVLPCKIGTPVYVIQTHFGCSEMGEESYRYVNDFTYPFTISMVNEFGKTVFLSYEEAEAATERRK